MKLETIHLYMYNVNYRVKASHVSENKTGIIDGFLYNYDAHALDLSHISFDWFLFALHMLHLCLGKLYKQNCYKPDV